MKGMYKKYREKNDQYEEFRELYYNKGLSPLELARHFRKSERTMYRWLNKLQKEGITPGNRTVRQSRRAKKYPPEIFERIISLKQDFPHRSASRIHQLLSDENPTQCPSVSTIRKYLREKGLTTPPSGRSQGYIQFARSRANELWQIDIAGVQTVGHLGKLYLTAILDDCSRYVLAAAYFRDQKGCNVLQVLRDAIRAYGRPIEIVADNGSQFKNVLGELGTKYTRLLDTLDIKPIFASPGHPQTKGKLERWFRTVIQMFLEEGRGYVKGHPQCTLSAFNQKFRDWVTWYNTQKPHKSLPNQIPPQSIFLEAKKRVFRPLQSQLNWDRWLGNTADRKVNKYNQISYKGQTFKIPPGYAGSRVDVIEFEERLEVYWKDQLVTTHPYQPQLSSQHPQVVRRKIKQNGQICYKGQGYSIDYKQAGKTVEIQETNQGRELLVYLNGILIRTLKRKEN